MGTQLVVYRGMPFAILFPKLHRLIVGALMQHCRVLQLRSTQTFLFVCAEMITREIVSLPYDKKFSSPYINLGRLRMAGDSSELLVEKFVVKWRFSISVCCDEAGADAVASISPRIFRFVKKQIRTKEQKPPFHIERSDIAFLVMLIIQKADVFYGPRSTPLSVNGIFYLFAPWFTKR